MLVQFVFFVSLPSQTNKGCWLVVGISGVLFEFSISFFLLVRFLFCGKAP